MGKKKANSQNIYEVEQKHKKHRKKSKKIEKREQMRKNKKKMKHERHYLKMLEKHVKQKFRDERIDIDMYTLSQNLDFEEIKKHVTKLIKHSETTIEEIPDLFRNFDTDKKTEIDLSGLEDPKIQKYITKLMKKLKLVQNPRNPYSFRVNLEDKNAQLNSYYLFVKGFFEFLAKTDIEGKEVKTDANDDIDEENENEYEEDEDDYEEESESRSSERSLKKKSDKKIGLKAKVKHTNDDDDMKFEYEVLEEKFGKNAELINKAFSNSILQDKKIAKEESENEEEEELCGPPVPKFLESTLNLLNDNKSDKSNDYDDLKNEEDSDVEDDTPIVKNQSNKPSGRINTIEDLVNTKTFKKAPSASVNVQQNPVKKLEPINKESYDFIMSKERERMRELEEQIEEDERNNRSESLMEAHQRKKALEKKGGKQTMKDFMMRSFDKDKDMNVGRVDSKRALRIMNEDSGLKNRFESKEKYLGI